jgi:nitric oxide reductase NorD protein
MMEERYRARRRFSHRAMSADEVELHLEEVFETDISSRHSVAPALAIASLEGVQQDFVLHWIKVVARTSLELAFQFAERVDRAFELMDTEGVEEWLVQAVDAYDRKGLAVAFRALAEVEQFAADRAARYTGVALADIAGVLERFITGLSGRVLKLDESEIPFTDTETLYLPPLLNLLPAREQNFQLYKAMAVHQWAQIRFGTWRLSLAESLAAFPDPDRALRLFHRLEAVRLDARVRHELPGVAREMDALEAALGGGPLPGAWAGAAAALAEPGARATDVLDWAHRLWEQPALPETLCYQGELRPERAAAVMAARIEREERQLTTALVRLRQELEERTQDARGDAQETERRPMKLDLRQQPDPARPGGMRVELYLEDKPVAPPEEVQNLINSILLDLGEIPDEYLHAAGEGEYRVDEEREAQRCARSTMAGNEGMLFYDEWDVERGHYRKGWCQLRELTVEEGPDAFFPAAQARYRGLVKSIRRTFEVLRGENKLLKRQPEGDDVDIDAVVDAYADARAGQESPVGLYTRMHRLERDIAVMFMVDMSGSTKGYAICGFSGMTRNRCEVFRVKRFDEAYDETVHRRIAGIAPKDYTRMGTAIRHLSGLLARVDARIRVLVTLSDGKPEDLDGYRGEYGIEDTRQALMEARRDGIHAYCVTLDTEAADYLKHMYGPAGYTVIDDVTKLPLRISDIYRKLTS